MRNNEKKSCFKTISSKPNNKTGLAKDVGKLTPPPRAKIRQSTHLFKSTCPRFI
jgi:hypothetical protein